MVGRGALRGQQLWQDPGRRDGHREVAAHRKEFAEQEQYDF